MASLLERIGMTVPIIQAPMAGTSTPADGRGGHQRGRPGLDRRRRGERRRRADDDRGGAGRRPTGPFNVNVFCHRPATADPGRERAWLEALKPVFERLRRRAAARRSARSTRASSPTRTMLELFVETRPAVVSFHFGLPAAADDRPAEGRRRRPVLHGDQSRRGASRRPPPASTPSWPRATRPAAIAACSIRPRPTASSASLALTRLLVREISAPGYRRGRDHGRGRDRRRPGPRRRGGPAGHRLHRLPGIERRRSPTARPCSARAPRKPK